MIRLAEPNDQPALDRLAIAQWQRTPWAAEGHFAAASHVHVHERNGRVTGCAAYRRGDSSVFVIHVWVEDGFAGQRAAVALMKDLEAMADVEELELTFNAQPENLGLRQAVEEHACEPNFESDPGSVFYKRRAQLWAALV